MRRLLLILTAGCSVLVEHEAAQCKIDADCEKYGSHPLCQNGVCVPSGLGPEGCFFGTPTTEEQYLNACSTASYLAFDNCSRLGVCGNDGGMPAPIDPTNATIPPLVNPVTVPTQACNAGASNMIYMYGTSDFGPLLKAVQPLLSAQSPPYRAVFMGSTSCNGVISVFDSTKRLMVNPAPTATPNYAYYFDQNGVQTSCLLDPAGNTIDIGVSNLFSETCNTSMAEYVSGTTVSDYTGPVVQFVLSVPSGSSQLAVSAEALHSVFGLGGKTSEVLGMKDANPWTDPTYYAIRNSNAGSTVLTALLIDVPKNKFWGVDRLSTDNLRDSLLASTAPEQSIGILSIDYADKNRGNLRSLYLQGKDQKVGYLPDSNKNSFDKMNVRDGHYPLWGYVHFFTPVGAGGVPSDAAKAFVTKFAVARIDQTLLDNIIAASDVPQCAMKVSRTSDIGDFMPQNNLSCGCYFDYKTTGKSSCIACQSASDCPADHSACNYGFCEVN
jgi:hypothetical protein